MEAWWRGRGGLSAFLSPTFLPHVGGKGRKGKSEFTVAYRISGRVRLAVLVSTIPLDSASRMLEMLGGFTNYRGSVGFSKACLWTEFWWANRCGVVGPSLPPGLLVMEWAAGAPLCWGKCTVAIGRYTKCIVAIAPLLEKLYFPVASVT